MGETKILVVILLLVIIFVGIAVFLFYLEHKISAAEKKIGTLEAQQKKENNPS